MLFLFWDESGPFPQSTCQSPNTGWKKANIIFLQNATAFVIRKGTNFYYKVQQLFYYKLWQILLLFKLVPN